MIAAFVAERISSPQRTIEARPKLKSETWGTHFRADRGFAKSRFFAPLHRLELGLNRWIVR
jgi:hypothetical protein